MNGKDGFVASGTSPTQFTAEPAKESTGLLRHLLPKKIRPRHIELAEKLYNFVPPVCWKTEVNLAAALGTNTWQIKIAKAYLEATGRVRVEVRPNGKRANPIHTLVKTSPINQYMKGDESVLSSSKLDWSKFEDFSPKDLSRMSVTDLLEFYAEIGLQPIPLHYPKFKNHMVYCACKKGRNCPKIGKHPALAWKSLDFSDRRTYRAMRSFWEDDVNYNIGFKVDGYAVIDVDYRKGGHLSLGYLEEELGTLPVGLSVVTGNGRHIYVQADGLPTSVEVMGLKGIDVRSTGGLVVAPCSVHASGRQYQWETLGVPQTLPHSWSEFFVDSRMRTQGYDSKQTAQWSDSLPTKLDDGFVISAGSRNDTLFRLACRERGKGAGYEQILDFVMRLYRRHCEHNPPMRDSELKEIAASAVKYPSEAEKRQQVVHNAATYFKGTAGTNVFNTAW